MQGDLRTEPASFVLAQNGALKDKKARDEVNEALAEVTDESYSWPQAGLNEIQEVLSEFEVQLPELDLERPGLEQIVPVNTADSGIFMYFYYDLNEQGSCEFYIEFCDEKELEDLLEDLDEDEEDYEDE